MSNFKNKAICSVLLNTEIQKELKEAWEYNLKNGTDFSMVRFKEALGELLRDAVGITKGMKSTSIDNSWRDDVKQSFAGRGGKWVYADIADVEEYLIKFENNGDDVSQYREFINKHGKAWIRFSGPRIHNGKNSAAFEIRFSGNKIDHPKHLMYIDADKLNNLEKLSSTPHKLGLENVNTAPKENNQKVVDEVVVESNEEIIDEVSDEVVVNESSEEIIDEVSDEIAESNTITTEPHTSNDPEEWEAWLKENSLDDDDDTDGETIYLDEAFEELE